MDQQYQDQDYPKDEEYSEEEEYSQEEPQLDEGADWWTLAPFRSTSRAPPACSASPRGPPGSSETPDAMHPLRPRSREERPRHRSNMDSRRPRGHQISHLDSDTFEGDASSPISMRFPDIKKKRISGKNALF